MLPTSLRSHDCPPAHPPFAGPSPCPIVQDIVDKFQYQATNPDLGNPATTRWVE